MHLVYLYMHIFKSLTSVVLLFYKRELFSCFHFQFSFFSMPFSLNCFWILNCVIQLFTSFDIPSIYICSYGIFLAIGCHIIYQIMFWKERKEGRGNKNTKANLREQTNFEIFCKCFCMYVIDYFVKHRMQLRKLRTSNIFRTHLCYTT